MNFKLHYNILSTYSQKAILAFYEKGVEFTPVPINLADPVANAEYRKIYPLGKIPLLTGDDLFIPESTTIIEFLENEFPNQGTQLIPTDKTAARRVRFKDRTTDFYLNNQISSIYFDSLKPAEKRNPEAVAKARRVIDTFYAYMDSDLGRNPNAGASDFNMSDCAAFAPLFYAQQVHPFKDHANITAYLGRMMQRASVQRLLQELMPVVSKM